MKTNKDIVDKESKDRIEVVSTSPLTIKIKGEKYDSPYATDGLCPKCLMEQQIPKICSNCGRLY
jgi:hypothetical protein